MGFTKTPSIPTTQDIPVTTDTAETEPSGTSATSSARRKGLLSTLLSNRRAQSGSAETNRSTLG